MDHLERDIYDGLQQAGQYEERLEADHTDRAPLIRATGRRVARQRGWKVRTLQTDLEDGGVVVHVLLMESNPLHQQVLQRRRDKLMRRAINDM